VRTVGVVHDELTRNVTDANHLTKHRRYDHTLDLAGIDYNRNFHVFIWDTLGRLPKRTLELVRKWRTDAPIGPELASTATLMRAIHAVLATAIGVNIRLTTHPRRP
jgi:hypothetical protein